MAKIQDIDIHEKTCQFKPTKCSEPGCGTLILEKDLASHELAHALQKITNLEEKVKLLELEKEDLESKLKANSGKSKEVEEMKNKLGNSEVCLTIVLI